MTPTLVFSVLIAYFVLLLLIAAKTSKRASNTTFFTADRQAPWYLVAFGMIGATLSGVTFISVTGMVGVNQFSYVQLILGAVLGYVVIGLILLPLYYRLNLISIYSYLGDRFGFWSYKTGSSFFLLSRVVGASLRLYLVAKVLQMFLFDELNIPFHVTVLIAIALIWLYTFRGGIKTIIWTDTLQTFFMLFAALFTIYVLAKGLNLEGFGDLITAVKESDYSKTFFFEDSHDTKFFYKQFFAGMFITIAMTGLDQDMMQKNLTCKNIKEAQTNIFWFVIAMVIVNVMFLCLGALLYLYASAEGIDISILTTSDELYPFIAKNHLGVMTGIVFLLGITAAAYSTADSALTSLTTAFCVDFLGFAKKKTGSAKKRMRRIQVHLAFSVILYIVILLFNAVNNKDVITILFQAAGYTYGPLLGLFAFGLFTRMNVHDKAVPFIAIASPVLSYIIQANSEAWFEYSFGFEVIILNAALTFVALFFARKK
jgi:SSS family transporter